MKISIITVSYNSAATIRDTIESVLSQVDCDVEYIIVDGQSSDATKAIINEYAGRIDKFISEPDGGIYEAMNKGLALATGDIIGILNSDDIYQSKHILHQVSEEFKRKQCDVVYGDLVYVERENTEKVVRKWRSGKYNRNKFKFGWMPPHPTFFATKAAYNQYGLFQVRLKNAADYELMLRFLYKHELRASYIPEVFVRMRVGGFSNARIANRIKANKEDRKAWEINGLQPSPFTLWLKPFRKIFQFVGFSRLIVSPRTKGA